MFDDYDYDDFDCFDYDYNDYDMQDEKVTNDCSNCAFRANCKSDKITYCSTRDSNSYLW